MNSAMIGSRFQVVIPKEARERFGLKPNTRVNIEAREEGIMIFLVKCSNLRGLGKELANDEDASDYVKRLRSEWGLER
ncbi:MAG: AbrB/MazE/SpoVT family DNA-binding domain-containing protein [Kiritimatiellia bacterium]